MLTTNVKEEKQYNIKEYAVENVNNRNKLTTDIPAKVAQNISSQIYQSHFDHSDKILEWWETHFNKKKKNTVGGYRGIVSVSEIIIDIDNDDLVKSQQDATIILDRLEKKYGVRLIYINTNFSGSKGFHIRIPSELFGGFEASEQLPVLVKRICTSLTENINIDESIYHTTALVRVPNTLNSKSGLYAIPLVPVEITNLSIDKIKEMAKEPRDGFNYPKNLKPVQKLVELKQSLLASAKQSPTAGIPSKSKTEESIFSPKTTGDRHNALTSIVGKLIKKGLSDDDIIHIALLVNNQNNPPKPEEDIITTVKDLLQRYNNNIEGAFWSIRGGTKVDLHTKKFIDFLVEQGFVKVFYDKAHIYVQIVNNIAEEVVVPRIKDYVFGYINSLDDDSAEFKDEIANALMDKISKYFNEKYLDTIKTELLLMKMDSRFTGRVYFNNQIVKAERDSDLQFEPYSALDSPIWKEQIIKRDFNNIKVKRKQSEYEQFIWNVAGKNEDRFLSICSGIGYLLHKYKNKAEAKAIVLMDEKISDLDNPNGRSGKSMFGKALSYMRNSVRIDGKNFEFTERFTFQQINIQTEIAEFNDVKNNFAFEKLFSVITDDTNLEPKGIDKFSIPFETSPKFLISTNYTVKGIGGSFKDRMFELEFSDHYNEFHKPIDEFGHLFFDDWDGKEWNRFDNFMLECLMLYIDHGLISYKMVNVDKRKLLDLTSPEFLNFIEANLDLGTEYKKKDLYNSFMSFIGFHLLIYEKSNVTQTSFTNWIRIYAQYKGYKYYDRRSNGSDYFTVKKND